MNKESILKACNFIMPFTCHRTVHPNINFAGGDLFSKECLDHFDGLLAFVHGGFSPLHSLAGFAVEDGTLKIPYILYGAAGDRSKMPTIMMQEKMIYDGLDELTSKGCRRIAFHGGAVTDATYVDGARECIRAIEKWISIHPDEIENITLVDLGDDYYIRFGHLLPWENGKIRRYVRHGGEFEYYFETHFHNDVLNHYNIYNGLADRMLKECHDMFFENDKLFFSIGVFYMNLIPQVIAKLTGREEPMFDFAKCAGWPIISCGPGGYMHSDVVLKDSGLFPDEGQIKEWKKLLLEEVEFFKSFTKDVISGDLWQPMSTVSKRLQKAVGNIADDCVNEIHRMVYDYVKCLDEESTVPTHIILGEELS